MKRRSTRVFGVLLVAFTAMACVGDAMAASSDVDAIDAIGVENEYADVIAQIGGTHVRVTAIESDPNTDPHSFEVNPKVARQVAAADLIVENGIGYDAWADKIISASSKPDRKVINVQHLLGLPDGTPNPHLWFDPRTMPIVAKAIATELSTLRPALAGYFEANVRSFDASLRPWYAAIAFFRTHHPNVPVAVTEPVADYMLQAAGCDIRTPYSLQAAIMNGTDPSPQDVTTQDDLFSGRKVSVFVDNQQVTDNLTNSFLEQARKSAIPVVGVYETMPAPGYNYQTWMLAEVMALQRAVTERASTGRL